LRGKEHHAVDQEVVLRREGHQRLAGDVEGLQLLPLVSLPDEEASRPSALVVHELGEAAVRQHCTCRRPSSFLITHTRRVTGAGGSRAASARGGRKSLPL